MWAGHQQWMTEAPCRQLENRVFSHPRIQEIASEFEWIKLDVRDQNDPALMKHKSTRYVPEVVLFKWNGEVAGRLETRDVEGVRAFLDQVR